MYANAKYKTFNGSIDCIQVDINGATHFIYFLNEANPEYAGLMELVRSGDIVIQPADEEI